MYLRLEILNTKFTRIFEYEIIAVIGIFGIIYFPYLWGPFSYVQVEDADVPMAFYEYFLFHHPGGEFMHRFGGGNDVGAVAIGSEYASVYSLLRSIFPIWLAVLGEKLVTFCASFGGVYLICRRVIGGSPAAAVIAAGLLILAFPPASLFARVSYAAALAAYACSRKWSTWPMYIIVFLALALGAMENPAHNIFRIIAASVFVPLMLGQFNLRRSTIFCGVLGILSLLNWYEAVYSWNVIASNSNRIIAEDIFSWAAILQKTQITMQVSFGNYLGLLSAGAMILLAYLRDVNAIRLIAAYLSFLVFSIFGGYVFAVAGVSFVEKVWEFVVSVAPVLNVVPVAVLLKRLEYPFLQTPGPLIRLGRIQYLLGFTGLSVLFLANSIPIYHNWVHSWNQSYFNGISNLANPDWKAEQPYRVINFQLRMKMVNILSSFYGLDTFDSMLNLKTKSHELYWAQLDRRIRDKKPKQFAHSTRVWHDINFYNSDDRSFDIAGMLSLPLLRVANVRYLISEEPLAGPELVQVSGPGEKPPKYHYIVGNLKDRLDRFRWRLGRFFDFGQIYVYDIGNALPRVFSPLNVIMAPPGIAADAFIRFVEKNASATSVVVRAEDADNLVGASTRPVNITSYNEVKNGIEVTYDSSNRGVVVVNFENLPFWKAYIDGQPAPIVSVNFIHMAVVVPPGTSRLSFRYERGTANDAIKRFLKNRI